jgi:hypothetical protein
VVPRYEREGHEHVCDPEARALSMVRVLGPILQADERKRARGYSVQ